MEVKVINVSSEKQIIRKGTVIREWEEGWNDAKKFIYLGN